MKTTGGGWRRIVELIAGTLAGLSVLAALLNIGQSANFSYAVGQFAVWGLIFVLVRRSRLRKLEAARPRTPVRMPPPAAWPNARPQNPGAAPTTPATPMQPPDPRF